MAGVVPDDVAREKQQQLAEQLRRRDDKHAWWRVNNNAARAWAPTASSVARVPPTNFWWS